MMPSEDLKQHLRDEHGVHEAPEEVVEPGVEASYGPDVSDEQLTRLHAQHHEENPDLLRHSHDDEPSTD
ncbi:MAG TPA: hypothetical protein VLA82_05715 [Actinomycetota bacterium]|nr:hypothetical protein [Actinomycetota bacterium]